MKSAHNHFLQNLTRARDLQALYVAIRATTTSALDPSDILRACLVLAVSALDHFIHEVARLGMLEIYDNKRVKTDAFGRFTVPLDNVLQGAAMPGSLVWLEQEVRRQHNWVSFQHPDRIADAVRLVSNKKLWEEVASRLGSEVRSVKNQLKLIVDRRNKIAHEADMDPSTPGARWPIDEFLTQDAIDAIEHIANAIFDVVTTP